MHFWIQCKSVEAISEILGGAWSEIYCCEGLGINHFPALATPETFLLFSNRDDTAEDIFVHQVSCEPTRLYHILHVHA